MKALVVKDCARSDSCDLFARLAWRIEILLHYGVLTWPLTAAAAQWPRSATWALGRRWSDGYRTASPASLGANGSRRVNEHPRSARNDLRIGTAATCPKS